MADKELTDQRHFHNWRPHPWHGLTPGRNPPRFLQAYIEITPFDSVKYEIDKETGYLRVNRPQRTSSLPPVLYGFVPRTYCGPRVAALLGGTERGDGDPLDICVFSERPINRSEVLLNVQVVGGLRSLDEGAVDDKIIAVLEGDAVWGDATDLSDIPPRLIERLRHYFESYKMTPGDKPHVIVQAVYGREDAEKVVMAAMTDYEETYGTR